MMYPSDPEVVNISDHKVNELPHLFHAHLKNFSDIGNHQLRLVKDSSHLSLPNLQQEFAFYGVDERPDADQTAPILLIGIRGNEEILPIASGRKVFISKDRKEAKSIYRLSQSPIPSGIWVVIEKNGQEAVFQLGLAEDETIPPLTFKLKQEARALASRSWEVGSFKVDSTLFARQKVRWAGIDLFLDLHGGQLYESTKNKQRIDFDENEKLYSCFIDERDYLVWKKDRWETASPGEDTREYTLLQIIKMDERLMYITLWSPGGRYKLNSSIIKIQDLNDAYKNVSSFIYLGAKGWNEWIFEVSGKRQTIRPQDWWIRQDSGAVWRKLASKEDIDAFVQLKIRGELFVVEKIVQENRKRYLSGHLFNSARTKIHPVAIPIKQKKNEPTAQTVKSNDPPTLPAKNENVVEASPVIINQGQKLIQSPTAKDSEKPLKLPSIIRGHTQ